MPIPWLTRPPTAEEVAAHAKAHPLAPSSHPTGRWLFLRDDGVAYFLTLMVGFRPEVLREYEQGARWLPCTAEGIPVCLLPVAVSFAECVDVTVVAMQLFAVAQCGLVDFLRERGVTGNLDALALEMLTACAVDAPSLPEGNEPG